MVPTSIVTKDILGVGKMSERLPRRLVKGKTPPYDQKLMLSMAQPMLN